MSSVNLKRLPLSVPEVVCRLQMDGVKAMILLARTFVQTLPRTGLLQPAGPPHNLVYSQFVYKSNAGNLPNHPAPEPPPTCLETALDAAPKVYLGRDPEATAVAEKG